MKRTILIMSLLVCTILLSGCSVKRNPQVSIGDITFECLERSEYVIMDTVQGSGSVTTVLGIPFSDGKKAMMQPVSGGAFSAIMQSCQSRSEASALYHAYTQAPQADAVLPISSTVETVGLWPFFQVADATVKAKAIRVKSDKELGMKQ